MKRIAAHNYPSLDAAAFDQGERPSYLPAPIASTALAGVDVDTLRMLNSKSVRIAAPIGSLAGIGYALAKNQRIGGIIGYMFLGSFVGIIAGRAIYEAVEK